MPRRKIWCHSGVTWCVQRVKLGVWRWNVGGATTYDFLVGEVDCFGLERVRIEDAAIADDDGNDEERSIAENCAVSRVLLRRIDYARRSTA